MDVMWNVIATVLSGLILFILSQFILKMVVEPIRDLKISFAKLSYVLLFYQSALANAKEHDGIQLEIKHCSADIIAK